MALSLSSPAFANGAPISGESGSTDRNAKLPLEIAGVPDDAASLALIVDDPDARAPADKVWDHWIVWNIGPETERIPEDWDAATAGAMEGRNDYSEMGYGGPNPPDREHTYGFELDALDDSLDFPAQTDADDLRGAVAGHILEEARLEGRYAP